MVYKNYMYYWHMINITFSWNENAMYRFFKMVTFIFILFNTECKEPNFGENCGQICKCGQGMDRCDPKTGCVCKPGWTGTNCSVDIDECDNETICGNEKVCKNLEGSYLCKCRVGFKMNGDICEGDIYHSFVHYRFIITYDLNILFRFNLLFSFKCDIIKC